MLNEARLQEIISPLRDYSPKTSPGELKAFMEGSIHEDFLNELAIRIEAMRDFNEECNSKEYLETRGAIKSLRLIAGIFTDLYENAKNDNTNTEEEQDE